MEDAILARSGFPGGIPAAGLSGAAIVVIAGPDPFGLSSLAVQRSPFAIDYLPLVRR